MAMTLSENFLREHQVLKDRTHPTMAMNGASGYILRYIALTPHAQWGEGRVVGNYDPFRKVCC